MKSKIKDHKGRRKSKAEKFKVGAYVLMHLFITYALFLVSTIWSLSES